MKKLSIGAPMIAVALTVAACGDDDDADDTPTSAPTVGATATVPAEETSTPAAEPTDPCTTRTGVGGETLVAGASFEAEGDAWQICVGGAAAGSSEKLLFRKDDGSPWTLISRTTLGNPPPELDVGEFPNQGSVAVIVFISADTGWIGLESAGQNLYRSQDGGMTWEAAEELPPGVPVTAIDFTDAPNGTVTTSDSTWTTIDLGDTWTETP